MKSSLIGKAQKKKKENCKIFLTAVFFNCYDEACFEGSNPSSSILMGCGLVARTLRLGRRNFAGSSPVIPILSVWSNGYDYCLPSNKRGFDSLYGLFKS